MLRRASGVDAQIRRSGGVVGESGRGKVVGESGCGIGEMEMEMELGKGRWERDIPEGWRNKRSMGRMFDDDD